jgi:MFS family permease
MPSYLVDFHGLSQAQMGGIMSAIGIGAAIGTVALPALSDFTGRKPVMIGSTIGVAGSLWMLAHAGSNPAMLFLWLGAVHLFNNACITLTVGPICAETVPPSLMATATGVVIACGELGGGGLAPIIAGQMADRFGIQHILWLPLASMGVAVILTLFLKETRWSSSHGQ